MEKIPMEKSKEKEYEVITYLLAIIEKMLEFCGWTLIIKEEKTLQGMFKEIDAENDEIVYQRDLIVYLKCLNEGSLEDRKVLFGKR